MNKSLHHDMELYPVNLIVSVYITVYSYLTPIPTLEIMNNKFIIPCCQYFEVLN